MEEYPGIHKGSIRFYHDGFNYRKDNKNLISVQQFRCSKTKCPGRALYRKNDPQNVIVTQTHNHQRNRRDFLVWKLRKDLNEAAVKDLSTPLHDLFNNICREPQHRIAAEQVEPYKERKRMRKLRRKALPKVPDSFEELEDKLWNDDNIRKMFGLSDPLPGEGEGEPFFRKGLHGPHGTTLVFASPFMVENCLKPASKAKLDATFKVMPRKPGGRQLLTIHACHGTHSFPVIFAVMQSKKKAAYVQLLEYIKIELCPQWDPSEIMMDFEKSLRMAVQEVYPECRQLGCYFHYTQAIQKRWSQYGLMKVPVRMREQTKELKNTLMALAFARAEDIPKIFEEIDEGLPLSVRAKCTQFLNYFRRTWLSQNGLNFKPTDFSVFGHPDRTNNHVESFHSRLHLKSPTIWAFLNKLIAISIEARQNFGRYNNALNITPAIPSKILLNDERIVNARQLLDAGRLTPLAFVKWCRNSTKDTLAVVRQGRRLRRHLKARAAELEYDDVVTSSDSSVASSEDEFDFEYNPNPHRMDVAANEDWEADQEWEAYMAAEQQEGFLAPDNLSEESLPDSNDSMWGNEEDEALENLEASQVALNVDNTPVVPPPAVIPPAARPPRVCIVCLDQMATVISLPCRHALYCSDCKPVFFANNCERCNVETEQLLDVLLT